MLRSEDGNMFTTYRSATAFMKSNEKYSKEDLKRLSLYPHGIEKKFIKQKKKTNKVKLKYEGKSILKWKTNPYLPKDWTCKNMKNKFVIRIKTEEGVKMSSLKAVRAFLKSNEKYSKEDFDRLNLYPSGQPRKNTGNWKTNKYLPDGWTGIFKNKRIIRIKSIVCE